MLSYRLNGEKRGIIMYKLTYTTKDELFGYETENAWFNLHAIDNKKDICITNIENIPENAEFLNWLKVTLKMEEKREPHLTASQIDELIELFQNFLEEDIDAPIYPTIEKFSRIMMSN